MERNSLITLSAASTTFARVVAKPFLPGLFRGSSDLQVPCWPLSRLLVKHLGPAPRVEFMTVDIEGSEPEALAMLGTAASFGAVVVDVSAGRRRVGVVRRMLQHGFSYFGVRGADQRTAVGVQLRHQRRLLQRHSFPAVLASITSCSPSLT